jgi:putative transposase
MAIRRYKPEQIVSLLRQIEGVIANGKTTTQACKEAEITQQTYYRWRKEYGGLKLDQAKRLKELEKENSKLKPLVAEPSLEKQILKDVAEGWTGNSLRQQWPQIEAAHELGRLLMGLQEHSRSGLMRAQWDAKDLQRAEKGDLRFTDDQIKQITAGVLARVAQQKAAQVKATVSH